MEIKKFAIRVFFSIIVAYAVSYTLFYFGIGISFLTLLILASLLLLIGIFLLIRAKKTVHREKEIIFANVSSIIIFFSIFGYLNFIGVFDFNLYFSLGMLAFFIFLFIRDGEFLHRIYDLNFIMITVVKLLKNLNFGKFTDPAILVLSALIAFILFEFGKTSDYEKSIYYTIAFAFSILMAIEIIIKMAFGM